MAEHNGRAAWISLVFGVLLALAGAITYLHATFVTYREFTSAITSIKETIRDNK